MFIIKRRSFAQDLRDGDILSIRHLAEIVAIGLIVGTVIAISGLVIW